ncbi:MAG: hypothetical protein BWY11_02219 [Firmicutes bacterium ADurb.Bin182]|nr:MAG: hypothetical protein BWY11_02219 [Firmicutes bacterium ADurb.Bin182]
MKNAKLLLFALRIAAAVAVCIVLLQYGAKLIKDLPAVVFLAVSVITSEIIVFARTSDKERLAIMWICGGLAVIIFIAGVIANGGGATFSFEEGKITAMHFFFGFLMIVLAGLARKLLFSFFGGG